MHCIAILSPTNEDVVNRFCRLTVSMVSYQHLVLKEGVVDLVQYFLHILQQCHSTLINNILSALNAIIYGNSGNVAQVL